MNSISASEAKDRFDELLDRVAKGEEIIITLRGTPVPRIAPEGQQISKVQPDLEKIRRAAAGLRQLQKDIAARDAGKEPLTWEDWKSMIEEGRR